nr:ABC transporter permease subunit [Brucella intermedia]
MESNNIACRSGAAGSILHNKRFRALMLQAVIGIVLLVLAAAALRNTMLNLESKGIGTGFAFLSNPAGFTLSMNLLPSGANPTFSDLFGSAIANTLLLAGITIVLSTVLGFLLALAKLARNQLLSRLAATFIEVVRNVPLLLQIFFWYFAILPMLPAPKASYSALGLFFLHNRGLQVPAPVFGPGFAVTVFAFVIGVCFTIGLRRWARQRQADTGLRFPGTFVGLGATLLAVVLIATVVGSPLSWTVPILKGLNYRGGYTVIPELVAMVIALTAYSSAFIAEIFRAGILAVPRGLREAAQALGLGRAQTVRFVVLPVALRIIIPPLGGQYLNLAKNTSLGAAIAYPEVMLVIAGTALSQTGQAVEVMAITMAIYLAISLALAGLLNAYNAHVAAHGGTR